MGHGGANWPKINDVNSRDHQYYKLGTLICVDIELKESYPNFEQITYINSVIQSS